MANPIGILGGTFDPVHNGHINLALSCYQHFGLGEVRLLPVNIPAHRPQPIASSDQRLAMLKLAVQGHSQLRIDERELHREGISYTIDTLKSLRVELDSQAICIILGMDAFQAFHTWHQWQLILDYAHIIVADRPGNESGLKQAELKSLFTERATNNTSILQQVPAGSILKIDLPMLDVSASQVRSLISADKETAHLLPLSVNDYIQSNKLYKTENG